MDKHQDTETASDNVAPSITLESTHQLSGEPLEQANDVVAIPPIERIKTPSTSFCELNEYCLLEIFSGASLDPINLCSIAQTCKLFRQVIQRIALKNKLIFNAEHDSRKYDIKFRMSPKRSRNDVERVFQIFGSRLSTVEIRGVVGEEEFLLNMKKQHCADDNFKSLHIYDIKTQNVFTVKLKPIFKHLQELHLKHVRVPYDATIFADLNSLVELTVYNVKNDNVIFDNIFPKLERFTYRESGDFSDPLPPFLRRHKKLQVLHVDDMYTSIDDHDINILQTIGDSCENLEDLHLIRIDGPYHPLQTLKSLTTLYLRHVVLVDLSFFSRLTKLRELTISFCVLPEDPDQYIWWTQITKLEIISGIGSIDVVGIIRRLTNLEVFEIINNFVLKEKTFIEIVTIVKRRPNVLTLKCQINFIVNSEENQRIELFPNLPTNDMSRLFFSCGHY